MRVWAGLLWLTQRLCVATGNTTSAEMTDVSLGERPPKSPRAKAFPSVPPPGGTDAVVRTGWKAKMPPLLFIWQFPVGTIAANSAYRLRLILCQVSARMWRL